MYHRVGPTLSSVLQLKNKWRGMRPESDEVTQANRDSYAAVKAVSNSLCIFIP